ncbi:MAG: hypothetical protein RLZZ252_1650 [Bacteroidota bacterium]
MQLSNHIYNLILPNSSSPVPRVNRIKAFLWIIPKNFAKSLWFWGSFLWVVAANSQDHHDQQYFPPADTLVQRKLTQWQGMKFGLLMHWGPYSQWGVVESWSICPEDEDWCRRRGPYASDYFAYRKAYEDLQKSFNPVQFRPELWAQAARAAGMKYAVFTTKHHDGFCMFDTKLSDYIISSSNSPFSSNPKEIITKEVFEAFRKQDMWVGAYFSKPDWHCPDYWDPSFPPYDRNPNYSIDKYPEKWNSYVQFTQKQINELMSGYGPIDILWLDGGWVQPMTASSPRWGYKPVHQDIGMDKIASDSRKLQPGLIVVDRAVEGSNQNYLTPEQQIPSKLLPYPWETCMTLGNSWSYVKNENYKSLDVVINNLCAIVSRGGNYLLNIAPSPIGEFDSAAYARLDEIGAWMKANGSAIYGSQPVEQRSFQNAFTITYNGPQKTIPILPVSSIYLTRKIENGKQLVFVMVSTKGYKQLGKGNNYSIHMNYDSMQIEGKKPKQVFMLTQNFPGSVAITPQGKKQVGIHSFNPFQNLTIIKSNYNKPLALTGNSLPGGINDISTNGIGGSPVETVERTLLLKQGDMTYVMSPVIVYCIEY